MFLFNVLFFLTQAQKDLLDAWERYAFLAWDSLGQIKTCSFHFSSDDYVPFCFGLFWDAFILPAPYRPALTKTHTIQSWKMESFCLSCPGWERNLLAILNTIVESAGVLSDFKVFLFSFSSGMLYTFAAEISDLKCLWSYKHMVGTCGMEEITLDLEWEYLAQALVLCHLCVCFTPREILYLKSMASFNPYGDPLS